MQDPIPIACTLSETELRDRRAAWLKVGAFGRQVKDIPGGLVFSFLPVAGIDESLAQLVRLEAECCAWMDLGLTTTAESVDLTIVGRDSESEAAIGETFRPLSLAISAAHRRRLQR